MTSNARQQKISECLFIVNNRQTGVLNRLHFLKCTLADPATRPKFLPGEKPYENAWKVLLKKFPAIDFKANSSALQIFTSQKDLFQVMSGIYHNFVDVLEVKDNVLDLLNRINMSGVKFEITINSELTRLFLELITNYFAMMLFLSRITDLKAIIALFNFLYQQARGKPEPNFSRIIERFIDPPELLIHNLNKDMNKHTNLILGALASLSDIFGRRIVRAQNWRDGMFLNILAEPTKISHAALSDQISYELIPYEMMERWVVFGSILIHPELPDNEDAFSRLRLALRNSYSVVLFREEVINIHSFLISFLESAWSNKQASKRLCEIKESLSVACLQAPGIHSDRRNYLRCALRQLYLIITDQPGLLGPQAFIVFWSLSYATDEVHWLLRHSCNLPPKKNVNTGEFMDNALPELLFYIENLKDLVRSNSYTIKRFHLRMLASYDAPGLKEYLDPVLSLLMINEVEMFNSMLSQLREIGEDQTVTQNREVEWPTTSSKYDFSGFRLDWLRIQAVLSAKDSPLSLSECTRLVYLLHSTVFHTKLVDQLGDVLFQVSNLSIFYFYRQKFEELFIHYISHPSQLRFIGVFPTLCCQFTQACHEICPHECFIIGRASTNLCKKMCGNLVDSICKCFFERVDAFALLSDQTDSHHCIPILLESQSLKSRDSDVNNIEAIPTNNGHSTLRVDNKHNKSIPSNRANVGSIKSGHATSSKPIPGMESLRRDRVEQTSFDKNLFTLSQFCLALTYRKEIQTFDDIFDPRMILQSELQSRVFERLTKVTAILPVISGEKGDESKRNIIKKPTDMLRLAHAVMDVLIELEDFVRIDVVTIFTTVFSQHTQPHDPIKSLPTITLQYAKWYMDCFMQQAYLGHFVYSPLLKSFVTMVSPDLVRFRAEEYADLNELKALVELIGPTGIKFMCDQLMLQIGHRIDEVKKLVLQNRTVLENLRGSFDDPVATRQLATSLQNSDMLLSYLKEIGVGLAFQSLCKEAVKDVLQLRIPFLLKTTKTMKSFMTRQTNGKLLPSAPGISSNFDMDGLSELFETQLITSNLCGSMGIQTELDANLCYLFQNKHQSAENASLSNDLNGSALNLDYHVACLFIVFVANALQHLARVEGLNYHTNLEANEGNIHCIAYAVTSLMIVMFSVLSPSELEERSTEFLALASSNLLRLGLETTSSLVASEISGGNQPTPSMPSLHKNRDSVYLIFDAIVRLSPFLTSNLQEACFPYALIRSAFHHLAGLSMPSRLNSNPNKDVVATNNRS